MIVLCYSGGIDSTVALYDLLATGEQVHALSVHYGQSHHRELAAAKDITAALGVPHSVTALDPALFRGSDLTGGDSGIVVPNRNMVLIAIAGSLAVRIGANAVAIACHAGDHALFPDCRPAFLEEAFRALQRGTGGQVRLLYPFTYLTKLEVIQRGVELSVPFETTWSCYAGDTQPCGECLACRERREALFLAGVLT
jgi:7-cyano-7-deazaguanine synthase